MQRQANTFFTLHTALFHSPHFTLHHLHFTLHTSSHLKSCELFSPHPTSSQPSLLTCHLSKFVSTVCISSGHGSTFLISSKFFSTSLSCFACQKALTVREKSHSCTKKNPWAQKTFAHRSLRHRCICTEKPHKILCTTKLVQSISPSATLEYKSCTKYSPILLWTAKLAQSTSQYYFVLESLHKALPCTTLYYKACTRHFTVLLCTTRLAQGTFQHYFVLQSLHRVVPSTTLYYKACTKHFPVLLCTTKLAQSTSQYYFVQQSLHKALPCTTLYYKACTKYFPVLLCITKLAQSTSQYYFVLQSLRKVLACITLYYKACTKYFPVLLCATKLAQSTSQYTLYYKACTKHFLVLLCTTKLAQSTPEYYFVLQSLHKVRASTTLYYTGKCDFETLFKRF